MFKLNWKLITINFILLLSLLFIIDIYSSYKAYEAICDYRYTKAASLGFNKDDVTCVDFEYRFGLIPFKKIWEKESPNFNDNKRRDIIKDNKDNKSVLLLGCSFAEGVNPDYKSNLNYILSDYTGYSVYNRAFGGFGPANTLWQVRNPKFYEGIKIPPTYILYVYVPYQPERIFNDKWGDSSSRPIYIGYNEKDGKLIENKSPFLLLCNFNWIKRIFLENLYENPNNSLKQKFHLFKLHILESQVELQKKYPNAKFIIVKYPIKTEPGNEDKEYYAVTDEWNEFKEKGIIIYDLEKEINADLTSKEYLLPDLHPNKKAWETIVPKLVKELSL